MKASKMTNERIAEELIATISHLSDAAMACTDADDILREAAARLRTFTLLSKAHQRLANDSVDYESNLLKKLKVAEVALEEITTGSFAHKDGDKPIVQVIIDIASKALFEIREKGANNGK